MGSPPVLDGARHCRPAELDVTLVAFRSSGLEGLSERWKMVGRDEFSIGINPWVGAQNLKKPADSSDWRQKL